MNKEWLDTITIIEHESLNRGILPESFDNCAWRPLGQGETVPVGFIENIKGVESIPARLPKQFIEEMRPWTDVYIQQNSI